MLVARFHGVMLSKAALRARHPQVDFDKIHPGVLAGLARENRLAAEAARLNWKALRKVGHALPVLAVLRNGSYVVLTGMRPAENGKLSVLVQDPQARSLDLLAVPEDEFRNRWSGKLVFVRSMEEAALPEVPFGLSWIVGLALAFKGVLIEIGVVSLFLHVVAFVTSIFAMIVFDKVIGYEGYSTLHTLFISALAAVAIASLLGYLRSHVLLHITAKLDIDLAQRISSRLFRLPVDFFQQSSTGSIAKKLQEASTVREFVTGQLLFTLIELSALVLIVPVLYFFSAPLTWIVIGFCVVLMIQTVLPMPAYRRNLEALYAAETDRQAMIVESVLGIETLKSLALEEEQKRTWLRKTAAAIMSLQIVARLGNVLREISGFTQKAMQLTVIWYGAQLVLAGDMTIGALIAFNIMAGRVSAPLVQLVGLISKYQEANLSIRMLGSIVNAPPERSRKGGISPKIEGEIVFENVTFSYSPDGPSVLKDVSFQIQPGRNVGIVGPSGSGKSTIARLIQGFAWPVDGFIRIDGYNILEYDLSHLRSSTACVLQENFLFKGTIFDNIAIGRPHTEVDEVILASKRAGAHEFIRDLPLRYETILEENASNLSGGQRQRICIARVLLRSPNIMVFDEATSALDPESEAAILHQLDEIASGRTMIFITHRLMSAAQMDVIMVVDQGRVVDYAPHDVLLSRCATYQNMWREHVDPQHRGAVA